MANHGGMCPIRGLNPRHTLAPYPRRRHVRGNHITDHDDYGAPPWEPDHLRFLGRGWSPARRAKGDRLSLSDNTDQYFRTAKRQYLTHVVRQGTGDDGLDPRRDHRRVLSAGGRHVLRNLDARQGSLPGQHQQANRFRRLPRGVWVGRPSGEQQAEHQVPPRARSCTCYIRLSACAQVTNWPGMGGGG